MDKTADFYSRPTYLSHGGATFNVYRGKRRQKGGSLLGALSRYSAPVIASAKKRAAGEAYGLAKDVIWSIMKGTKPSEALRRHGVEHLKKVASGMVADGLIALKDYAGAGKPPRKRRRIVH